MQTSFSKKIRTTLFILVMMVAFLLPSSVMAAPGDEPIGVSYRGHVENKGDMPKPVGTMIEGPGAIGTRGQCLRVEGFWIDLTGTVPAGAGINYQVHVQNEGWMKPVSSNEFAGTAGRGLRVESIRINLVNLPGYEVYYRGHVQDRADIPMVDGSWGWVKDGAELGTTGSSLRLEELQIKIVKKDGVDLTAYQTLLDEIEALDETLYTEESFGALTLALNNNKMTTANSQVEIDAAILAIGEKVDALEYVSDVTIYDEAGVYGPEVGSEIIDGDVVVAIDGVTLRNLNIKGKLTISEGVGDGSVILNNLKVDGETFVNGGGANSVYINGGSYAGIYVNKPEDGRVRIVVDGVELLAVTIPEDAIGEDVVLEGVFDKVNILAKNAKVEIKGTVGTFDVPATSVGSYVVIDATSQIEKMILGANTAVTGSGVIKDALVNANGVSFETRPVKMVVDPSVTVLPVAPPEIYNTTLTISNNFIYGFAVELYSKNGDVILPIEDVVEADFTLTKGSEAIDPVDLLVVASMSGEANTYNVYPGFMGGVFDVGDYRLVFARDRYETKTIDFIIQADKTHLVDLVDSVVFAYESIDGTDILSINDWTTSIVRQTIDAAVLVSQSVIENVDVSQVEIDLAHAELRDAIIDYYTAKQKGTREASNNQKLTADLAILEAIDYSIPLSEQDTQATKTAWLQDILDTSVEFGSTVVVTFNNVSETYRVVVTNGSHFRVANIVVEDAVVNVDAENLVKDLALIDAFNYVIPVAQQTTQRLKNDWVKNTVNSITMYGSSVEVAYVDGGYLIHVINGVEKITQPLTVSDEGVSTLAGTVALTGGDAFGKTVKATVKMTNNTGDLTYAWYRGLDVIENQTSNEYTLTLEDIGEEITVRVTSSVEDGSIEGVIASVKKADGPNVGGGVTAINVSEDGLSDGSLTGVSAIHEYRQGEAGSWISVVGDSVENLAIGDYYVRVSETNTHTAGVVAGPFVIS